MKLKEAEKITHTLSKPGKMPGYAYSTPAAACKTGSKLRLIPGSVCANLKAATPSLDGTIQATSRT